MRSSSISAVLLSVVLAAGCAQDTPMVLSPEGLDAQIARSAAQMVPFRATYRSPAGLQPVPPEVCSTELADITSGGGQATHLGRFTGETFSCVDLATLQVTDGRFTMVGADGSQITGTHALQGTPLSQTVIRLEGPFTITGGSRRFEGASGGGQIAGTIDLETNQLVLEFDGTVSSVGSLK
jgi:hypothetical protein